jgi:hypothetical protein
MAGLRLALIGNITGGATGKIIVVEGKKQLTLISLPPAG